jgi:hypothetical protein
LAGRRLLRLGLFLSLDLAFAADFSRRRRLRNRYADCAECEQPKGEYGIFFKQHDHPQSLLVGSALA